MTVEQFVSAQRDTWQRLAELCDRLQQRGATLDAAELAAFGACYRQTASDLAYAHAHLPNLELLAYLNRLVARAHAQLYVTRRAGWRSLPAFFAGYPAQWRAAWPFLAVSAALLLGSALLAAVLVAGVPQRAGWFVPAALRASLAPAETAELSRASYVALSTFILTNNLTAALLAFATGVLFGLGTALALIRNGLLLGALAGLAQTGPPGAASAFWSLILPHGVLELAALITCGAAGLQLGYALLAGGRTTRQRALAEAARRALPLVLGAAPWFVLAAVIEGQFTPLPAPPAAKLAFAAMTAGLLAVYLAPRSGAPEARHGSRSDPPRRSGVA